MTKGVDLGVMLHNDGCGVDVGHGPGALWGLPLDVTSWSAVSLHLWMSGMYCTAPGEGTHLSPGVVLDVQMRLFFHSPCPQRDWFWKKGIWIAEIPFDIQWIRALAEASTCWGRIKIASFSAWPQTLLNFQTCFWSSLAVRSVGKYRL